MTTQIPAWSTTYYKGFKAEPGTREAYGVGAVKRELRYNGYTGLLSTTSLKCGVGFERAVKWFQRLHGESLSVDGVVGAKTGRELFRKRIFAEEVSHGVADHWAWKLIGWESIFDPIAIYFNPNDTIDRGLIQANSSTDKTLGEAGAYDPAQCVPYLCQRLKGSAVGYAGCAVDEWKLAVAAHRTPVGADYWCDHPELQFPAPPEYNHKGDCPGANEPGFYKCWGEQAAYYVTRVSAVTV